MSTISTLSLSHTHAAYVPTHIHTQDWLHTFKNPYTPSILETQTHIGPAASPPFPGTGTEAATATFTHTHTVHHPSHQSQGHIRQSSCLLQIYSVSVTHVICVTQTVATPLLKHSLLPMLWGLQPGCQSKIPHLQFHVFSDKKIS